MAQVVNVVAAPILTRLFDPSEFGVLAIIISIAGVLAAIACLKYDMAIVLAKKDSDAAGIFLLCGCVVLVVSLSVGCFMYLYGDWVAALMKSPEAGDLMFLIPVMLFFGGSAQAAISWNTRRKWFKWQSFSKVTTSFTTAAAQIGFGLASFSGAGLLFGRLIGESIGSMLQSFAVVKNDFAMIFCRDAVSRMGAQAREHKDFPRFTAPRALLVNLSNNFVPMFLGILFGPAAAGSYWLTHRLVWMPTTLLGQAVQRVFYQQATEIHHDGKSIAPLLIQSTWWMMAIGAIPSLLLMLLAPPAFILLFGENWGQAGLFAQWMALWWFTTFAAVPSNSGIFILGLQQYFLFFEAFGVVLRGLALYVGSQVGDAVMAIAFFSATTMLLNFYRIYYVIRRAKAATTDAVPAE